MIRAALSQALGRALGSAHLPSVQQIAMRGGVGYTALLDETTGALSPSVTFTRSTTATYFDVNGVMQSAAINTPRYDYQSAFTGGTNGVYRGLLIEEQRTNSALQSEDFSNASWTKTTTTVTANAAVAPDGATTMDTLTATGANSTTQQAVTTTAVSWTYAVFLRRKTGTGNVDITMDGTTWVTQTLTTSPKRFQVTQTGVAGTSNPGIRIVTSGDEVYAWGAQAEAGIGETSYIPTTAATVTRAVDVAKCTTLASIGYNAAAGTLFAEVTSGSGAVLSTNQSAFELAAPTASPAIALLINSSTGQSLIARGVGGGGGSQAIQATASIAKTVYKMAGRYTVAANLATAEAFSVNGGAVNTNAVAAVNSVATISEMHLGVQSISGQSTAQQIWIRRARYYSRGLSNAELQSVTT